MDHEVERSCLDGLIKGAFSADVLYYHCRYPFCHVGVILAKLLAFELRSDGCHSRVSGLILDMEPRGN